MKAFALCLAAATCLLTGCLLNAVHPYCREADVVMEPGLVGRWADTEGKEIFRIKPTSTNHYILSRLTAQGDITNLFEVRCFKIGDQLFLDCFAIERHPNQVPMHNCAWVTALKPNLKIAGLNRDWLHQHLRQHPEAVDHVWVPSQFNGEPFENAVLTAPTDGLRAFLIESLRETQAWNKSLEFRPAAKSPP